jgi:hypothetical protein
MTDRVTFLQADLKRALRAAKAEGMVTRLRPDGSMEFVPDTHSAPVTRTLAHGVSVPAHSSLEGWMRKRADEGPANGRP